MRLFGIINQLGIKQKKGLAGYAKPFYQFVSLIYPLLFSLTS